MMIKYGLLSSESLHNNRGKYIIESWGKEVDLTFFSDKEELPYFFKCSNNTTRDSAPEKIINGLKKIYDEKYDWFFLGDDDTFVFTDSLQEYVKNIKQDYVLISHIWSGDPSECDIKNIKWASGGAGMLIGKSLMKDIMKKINDEDFVYYKYSDVMISVICGNLQCEFLHEPRFHWNKPSHFNININQSTSNHHLTFHYVDEEDIKNLYKNK